VKADKIEGGTRGQGRNPERLPRSVYPTTLH
jgi:hypothetical protein